MTTQTTSRIVWTIISGVIALILGAVGRDILEVVVAPGFILSIMIVLWAMGLGAAWGLVVYTRIWGRRI